MKEVQAKMPDSKFETVVKVHHVHPLRPPSSYYHPVDPEVTFGEIVYNAMLEVSQVLPDKDDLETFEMMHSMIRPEGVTSSIFLSILKLRDKIVQFALKR